MSFTVFQLANFVLGAPHALLLSVETENSFFHCITIENLFSVIAKSFEPFSSVTGMFQNFAQFMQNPEPVKNLPFIRNQIKTSNEIALCYQMT